jgi:hypothetical protein
MPGKDPKELDAEIEKARREILELQQRIHEMQTRRERLLSEAKDKSRPPKNGKGRA